MSTVLPRCISKVMHEIGSPVKATPVAVPAAGRVRVAAGLAALLIGAVAIIGWDAPAWALMWALALALFAGLKAITVAHEPLRASAWRVAAYVGLWPGMDARAFLDTGRSDPARARFRELAWALAKLAFGAIACGWAIHAVPTAPPLLFAWVGMIGLVFVVHFGVLHALSWGWRRAGVDAPPIMRAPILADSLAAFWGGRWNAAFADAARRLVLRPLARRWGVNAAGAAVFLISGLVHELVISVPARGGWGGPTVYFLLQGAGLAVEKSRVGKRAGLGAGPRGWLWTLGFTAAPLPLLFHAPFAHRVIVPFFAFLHRHLP